MTDDKKPREWTVKYFGYSLVADGPTTKLSERVPVIEKAAYDALAKENEGLKAKIKELKYMNDENHNCPLCDSKTEMRQYEYHPDMRGPKPYNIVCLNKDCGHSFMPSFVEHHIDNFEMLMARKENEKLKTENINLYSDLNLAKDGVIEALKERDSLREENEELKTENVNLYSDINAMGDSIQTLILERDSLREKLEIAVEALVAISGSLSITGKPSADADMATFTLAKIKGENK
jgi:cell division protein FtsB